MRILFLTTNNLTTNPRLLKELKLLSPLHDCSVVCFKLGNWSDNSDDDLVSLLKGVQIRYLTACRTPFVPWLIAGLVQKLSKILYPFFKRILFVNAFASDRRAFQLTWHLRRKTDFDLVVGHNLGSFYPAWRLASRLNKPFALDIEDYHPGERVNIDAENELKRRGYLFAQLLGEATYVSCASPLIEQTTFESFASGQPNHFVVNNSFLQTEFVEPRSQGAKLKIVWFSQVIDGGRGLERLLPILDRLSERIELHLFGFARTQFREEYLDSRPYIVLQGVRDQLELHAQLADYDIGLAIEDASQDLNRDLCLTNKLFAYVQAGLYVLCSNTQSQVGFMESNPWSGEVFSFDDNIESILVRLFNEKSELRNSALDRYRMARSLAFEEEQPKLLNALSQLKLTG